MGVGDLVERVVLVGTESTVDLFYMLWRGRSAGTLGWIPEDGPRSGHLSLRTQWDSTRTSDARRSP